LDIAKHVFQVHGVDETGTMVALPHNEIVRTAPNNSRDARHFCAEIPPRTGAVLPASEMAAVCRLETAAANRKSNAAIRRIPATLASLPAVEFSGTPTPVSSVD